MYDVVGGRDVQVFPVCSGPVGNVLLQAGAAVEDQRHLQQNGEIQAAVIQPLGDVRGIGAVEMKPVSTFFFLKFSDFFLVLLSFWIKFLC